MTYLVKDVLGEQAIYVVNLFIMNLIKLSKTIIWSRIGQFNSPLSCPKNTGMCKTCSWSTKGLCIQIFENESN